MTVGRRKGTESRERLRAVHLLLLLPATLVVLLSSVSPVLGSMDITAFEYFRKFGKHLELGECPQREVLVQRPDNTTVAKLEICMARQRGNISNLTRPLHDVRHVLIPTPNDIVAHLGLCGGEAASFLGILNNGDCVAVEIASNLTFSPKTLVRAYVEYYRTEVDILETGLPAPRDGFAQYVEEKVYVKNRDYGTLDFILVQFRFRTVNETERAKNLSAASRLMSQYMEKLEREVGKPKNVVVISMSTATDQTFRLTRYAEDQWGTAVRDVQVREMEVVRTRELINSSIIRPHLHYQFLPFVKELSSAFRISLPMTWEAITMIEVSLRASLSVAKKTKNMCDKPIPNRRKPCRRVRELKLKLEELQQEIHQGRSAWLELTASERQGIVSRYQARADTYSSVTRNLARAVRRMRKQEKLEQAIRRKNRRNQVELPPSPAGAGSASRPPPPPLVRPTPSPLVLAMARSGRIGAGRRPAASAYAALFSTTAAPAPGEVRPDPRRAQTATLSPAPAPVDVATVRPGRRQRHPKRRRTTRRRKNSAGTAARKTSSSSSTNNKNRKLNID